MQKHMPLTQQVKVASRISLFSFSTALKHNKTAASRGNPANEIVFYLRNGYLQRRLCEVFRLEGDDVVGFLFTNLSYASTDDIPARANRPNFKATLSHGYVASRNSKSNISDEKKIMIFLKPKHNLMGPTFMTSDDDVEDLVPMSTSYWSLMFLNSLSSN